MDLEDFLIGEDDVVPRARYTSPEFAALEFDRLPVGRRRSPTSATSAST
jgi:hypothetical protein